MIGDRKGERDAIHALQMRLHDPPVERLRQAVGGDQAEAAGPSGAHFLRRARTTGSVGLFRMVLTKTATGKLP
jgi:hypothetical protein